MGCIALGIKMRFFNVLVLVVVFLFYANIKLRCNGCMRPAFWCCYREGRSPRWRTCAIA